MSSNQTYGKLIKILEDMKINSREILPQDIKVEEVKVEGETAEVRVNLGEHLIEWTRA